jgi:hypothetical protein
MSFLTLAGIAIGAQATGAVTGGLASGAEASYKAQVAANNAKMAEQAQQYAATAASSQVENAGLKARAQFGEVRTGLAANNIDVNSGTAANVQESQRLIGAKEVSTVASNAARQVYGYGAEEQSDVAQAKLYGAEAPYDIASGFISAAGDVAGGWADLDLKTGNTGGAGAGAGPSPTQLSGLPTVPPLYQYFQMTGGGML